MHTRRLKTRPEWEDAMRSGRKTIDARLATASRDPQACVGPRGDLALNPSVSRSSSDD